MRPEIRELTLMLAEIAVQDYLADLSEAGDNQGRPATGALKNQSLQTQTSESIGHFAAGQIPDHDLDEGTT
jgi:hypothetical protein